MNPSVRSQVIMRRTYNRPLNSDGTEYETWADTVGRAVGHQRWLWEEAKGKSLNGDELRELEELRRLMLRREVSLAGRTLWLGGTPIARTRASSQFNCSMTTIRTVHDLVDAQWLLLQGCGVGFKPIPGILNGFSIPINDIEVIRTERMGGKGGYENNHEHFDSETGVWKISVGDSASSWAKAVGKLVAGKHRAKKLILDFSQIRPAGQVLKGYGWISSGDEAISRAFVKIAEILSRRAGQLLSRIDIIDIVNHQGTILSSRRSAEAALMDYEDPEWVVFSTMKKDHHRSEDTIHRAQSNNTLLFNKKPSKAEISHILNLMVQSGGSEPGLANAVAAKKKAPWFVGFNPCFEICLGDKSFCNLVETDVSKFNGRFNDLLAAHYIIARANYRQTCVDLRDGVLQETWHQLNQFLKLCGVGITGVVAWEHHQDPVALSKLRDAAIAGAHSMADELYLPRSKAVTTVKPSGTLSKAIFDCTEGAHKPLGKFIFNNVNFSRHHPVVGQMKRAGYHVFDNPYDTESVLATMPVRYDGIEFDIKNGVPVNLEPAIAQLNRYALLTNVYANHNCSITVYYSPDEIPSIVNWLYDNWDFYVGVSFLPRTDPTMRAEDLGYPYLPQEVVSEEEFLSYNSRLKDLNLEHMTDVIEEENLECQTGACPVR